MNKNAASKSAHLYGSTFDISYAQFKSISGSKGKKGSTRVLSSILEEVLTTTKKAIDRNQGISAGLFSYYSIL